MLRQYLSSSVRSIFLDEKENAICEVYELPISEKLVYRIDNYELPIYALELHLYHFGAGVLFIHTKNNRYKNIDDIRKINDYGRRISLPFLPERPDGFILCAEKLGICNLDTNNQDSCITDFREAIKNWYQDSDNVKEETANCLTKPAKFLFQITGCSESQIKSTSDDRMFVFCLLRDNVLSEQIKKDYSIENDELNKLLYQIIYVDADSLTCQNTEMRRRLLSDAIYDRWSDYGTIYGVTNYSMICITSEKKEIKAGVVKPFLIEYKYLVSLGIAQKIGITLFSEMAGNIVEGVDHPKMINRRQAKKLINLQEQYITFKNQLLVLEASCQEQGIELYQLLQKKMRIYDEQEILDEQLESLYEVTNVSSGKRIESLGIKLTLIAFAIDFIYNVILPKLM